MNVDSAVNGTPAQLDAPAMLEELVIGDVDTLRALTDRTRLQIMEAFARRGGDPRTVKDIARELGEAPTKLYYHVNLLEQHGLLVVAGSRLVSGIVEKSYMPSAKRFRVDRELLRGASASSVEIGDAIANVLDSATEALRAALASGRLAPGDRRGIVSHGTVRLTPDQAARIRAVFAEIADTADSTDATATDYALTVSFHPTAGGSRER